MNELPLANSDQKALVDDDIWLKWCHYSWRLKKSGAASYVVRSDHIVIWDPIRKKRRRKTITLRLHREVMGNPEGFDVHHRNGNTLDNRRENLELVDPKKHDSMSGAARWSRKASKPIAPGAHYAEESEKEEIPF